MWCVQRKVARHGESCLKSNYLLQMRNGARANDSVGFAVNPRSKQGEQFNSLWSRLDNGALCKTNHQVKCGKAQCLLLSRGSPLDVLECLPPSETRRRRWGRRQTSAGWLGSGVLAWFRTQDDHIRVVVESVWNKRALRQKLHAEKNKIKSHWEPLQRRRRGFFPALRPLIIHLNRRLGMCFGINNWKGGQLINKTNWAIYYLRGSPFIIWCDWRWVHSSGLHLCFAQSPNWWSVPNHQQTSNSDKVIFLWVQSLRLVCIRSNPRDVLFCISAYLPECGTALNFFFFFFCQGVFLMIW